MSIIQNLQQPLHIQSVIDRLRRERKMKREEEEEQQQTEASAAAAALAELDEGLKNINDFNQI